MLINYQNKLEINTTPGGIATWAELMDGIANLEHALNEVVNQTSYMADAGWGSSNVSGGQLTVKVTGDRIVGNAAQDYICSTAVQYAFGSARETQIKITLADGRSIVWDVTLTNIKEFGGDANKPASFSVDIHGNGEPQVIGGNYLGGLTVVSLAGAQAGDTAIYVNPALSATGYVYRTGANIVLPEYGEILIGGGWIAWNGLDEIAAITGDEIVIAEVDVDDKAVKAGKAIVTANAGD